MTMFVSDLIYPLRISLYNEENDADWLISLQRNVLIDFLPE